MASFPCVFLLFIFFCIFSLSHGRENKLVSSHMIDVHVNSLIPPEELTCTRSSRGLQSPIEKGVSMEVMHRDGACSNIKSAHVSPSHTQLLQVDQERVDSFHARISGQSVNLPAKSGATIGTGNYIVTVGLGTPHKTLSLFFDTGSDLTWTQCKPCVRPCYTQVDPIFDPSSSSSYTNISCTSSECSDLYSATGKNPDCSSSTCIYKIQYGDSSFSSGCFAKERISLSSTDYMDGFLFGCGENNHGLFIGAAGILGLGRDKLSLISQAADKYGNYFSYCLPTEYTSTGHLTLGHGGCRASSYSYTPLARGSGDDEDSYYYINLESISVGGRRLDISPGVFSDAGTIIDSGTVITRLPPKAFSVLNSTFSEFMSKYPSAPGLSVIHNCYDFTNYDSVTLPTVALYFSGGAVLDLPPSNFMLVVSKSQACLAFAGNREDFDVGIVGNVQQKGFDVVYDVDGGRIGFGAGGC